MVAIDASLIDQVNVYSAFEGITVGTISCDSPTSNTMFDGNVILEGLIVGSPSTVTLKSYAPPF